MKQEIDSPVAQLILDLEQRGLLNRTLVVLASEFGRDMLTEGKVGKQVRDQVVVPDVITEPKHYGMHRHFTGAGCVVMWGGGIAKGLLYGKTADERLAPRSRIRSHGRSPRDHLPRAGNSSGPLLCRRKAARLCHQGWKGRADYAALCLKSWSAPLLVYRDRH